MKPRSISFQIAASVIMFLWSCSTTGVNPTGLAGGQVICPLGPRPVLDCRGVLQQYARDLKADLNFMSKTQVGLGLTTSKLTEADALTSDLLQHYYSTCTLYNGCVISSQDYAAKAEKLQEIQLQVRRALVGGGYAQQQNIQINPLPGAPFPGGYPPGVSPYPGAPPVGYPQAGGSYPPVDPGSQQFGIAQAEQFPGQPPTGQPPSGGQFPSAGQNPGPSLYSNVPQTGKGQVGDAIINVLRQGSKQLRGITPVPTQPGAAATPSPATKAPDQDLDASLRAMLQTLKQDIARRNPALASARVVVGNFTEANQPWSSPLGALLQNRVSAIVGNEGLFKQSTSVLTRGITVKEVASVGNANDPRALTSLYNADLAIAGTYQPQGDGVAVKLFALQNAGEIAQTSKTIAGNAIPDVVATTPQNATDTSQLINSFNQIAPQAEQTINITTNRPGPGSSFRLGEEIIYFVGANTGGYLYLFHTDADKNVVRIFPNQYQREARIQPGQALQVPAAGAPFKFEASPPFGLETTFAIVTAVPLDEKDFQLIENGFSKPKQDLPSLIRSRGIGGIKPGVTGSAPSLVWNHTTVLIRP